MSEGAGMDIHIQCAVSDDLHDIPGYRIEV